METSPSDSKKVVDQNDTKAWQSSLEAIKKIKLERDNILKQREIEKKKCEAEEQEKIANQKKQSNIMVKGAAQNATKTAGANAT